MRRGRTIADRILLACLAPLLVVVAVSVAIARVLGYSALELLCGEVLVVLSLLFIARWVVRRETRRLNQLGHSADRIRQGDRGARLPVGTENDELSDLTLAFNYMADVITARENALRDQNVALASLNHRLQSVLNATNDGIALLDPSGRFALVNRRFCELLDTSQEALLDRTVTEAEPKLLEQIAATERIINRMASLTESDLRDPVGVAEETLEFTSPVHRFLHFYTAPVQSDTGHAVIGRIIALRDVTRERELDRIKTEFISVVSHELRTPLTSIKGYSDLLLSGAAGEIGDLQREFLGFIKTSTARLSNLINDILDISRIESGRVEMRLDPVDYRKIVEDAVRSLKTSFDEHRIALSVELPESLPLVRGEEEKILQVLTNLVSNAVKYTPAGGSVSISVELTQDAAITTCVQDTGIGISTDDQKRLFQRFFRADNSSTREAGGTGLGLVIAKTIVELLGGAIWVESEINKGSRFYFTLPLYAEAGKNGAAVPAHLPDRGTALVLLVTGNPQTAGLIEQQVHRRGYGLLTAQSALEGLEKARRHKPDAVIIDLLLPDQDGLEFLTRLSLDPSTALIPVMVITTIMDSRRSALHLGAVSFLSPADIENIASVVWRLDDLQAGVETQLRSGGTATVLWYGPQNRIGEEHSKELAALTAKLNERSIALAIAHTPEQAIHSAISQKPVLVIIRADQPDSLVLEFVSALKSEETAGSIPMVFVTESIRSEGILFHVGGGLYDSHSLGVYLSEQLSRMVGQTTPSDLDAGAVITE